MINLLNAKSIFCDVSLMSQHFCHSAAKSLHSFSSWRPEDFCFLFRIKSAEPQGEGEQLEKGIKAPQDGMQRDSANHRSHTRLEVLEPHPHPPAPGSSQSLCRDPSTPMAGILISATYEGGWKSRARALPWGCSAAHISRTGTQ